MFEIKPSFDEVRSLISETKGNLIPVYKDIPDDFLTPVTAYLKLSKDSTYSFLLESVIGSEVIGRFSFVGVDPYKVIKTGPKEDATGDPLLHLDEELKRFNYISIPNLPISGATGGAFGYISYDCIQYFEPRTANSLHDPIDIPESIFMLCDSIVAFDHLFKSIKVITHIHAPQNVNDNELRVLYDRAECAIDSIIATLNQDHVPHPPQPPITLGYQYQSNTSQDGYMRMVETLKDHIKRGDIFQAVPAQRITRKTNLHPFNAYRYLRTVNPAPYMYYFDFADFQVVGASPEMLARVQDGRVFSHPIAGTRKRGRTPEEDDALAKELIEDKKERAEHVMLVDLGRNDLNRVCEPDSVNADRLMTVERYSHVMHIVSNLSGKLRPGMTGMDAFRSIFPAGTLSGAPKVRAVQLIYEVEGERRGLYGGAVGRFEFSGNLDTCIGIRTMIFKDGNAILQAGAGVVHDSDPASEWQETLNKAMSNLTTIDKAERMHASLQKSS